MLESVLYTVAQGSMNLIKACDFEKHCDEYAIFLFSNTSSYLNS